MAVIGWYYLHKNGDLIYKRDLDGTVADLRDSDLVKMFWHFDPDSREQGWNTLVEAASIGANKDRIKELAGKWGCNDEDAKIYAKLIGVKVQKDGAIWCVTPPEFIDLDDSPAGFGDTILEALAELCKNVGYVAQKTWGRSFKDLV